MQELTSQQVVDLHNPYYYYYYYYCCNGKDDYYYLILQMALKVMWPMAAYVYKDYVN